MLLTSILLLPLLGALIVLALPASLRVLHRTIAITVTGIAAILSLFLLLGYQGGIQGYQFIHEIPWVPSIGLNYRVGVDGINLGLVIMAAWVSFAAVLVSYEIRQKEKLYYFLLLLMSGGVIGTFASLDMIFFYAMHELALIPTFIMIGIWGRGEKKVYSAFQMAIYLSIGAMMVLAGIICLYAAGGAQTFDMEKLAGIYSQNPMPISLQKWILPLLLFGFGILVGLVPFHSWAPAAYTSAPSAAAMIHAGVLKKFGLYGIVRLILPIMPQTLQPWMEILVIMALINAIYCGLIAIRQKCFAQMISYSSLSHVGFIFLGIAVLNSIGLTGAIFLMIAHGFLAALLFALNGRIYQQIGNTNMDSISGLMQKMPFIGMILSATLMAGCGLPFFGNFVGEFMIFFGTWQSHYSWPTALAVFTGLIISAVYMLRAIRRILHGNLSSIASTAIDAENTWRKLPFILLMIALISIGTYPIILTNKIKDPVNNTLEPVISLTMPDTTNSDSSK